MKELNIILSACAEPAMSNIPYYIKRYTLANGYEYGIARRSDNHPVILNSQWRSKSPMPPKEVIDKLAKMNTDAILNKIL